MRYALPLLALLVLAGCSGNREAALVGKWKGQLTLTPEQEKDPNVAMAKAMFGSMTFDLEMKKEKKFAMTMMGFPVEGSWSLGGDAVTLKTEKFMGMTMDQLKDAQKAKGGAMQSTAQMDKPLVLILSADGKTLTAKPDAAQQKSSPGSLVFTKQSG